VALPERAEIVVIGAGHNGLTCAAYLALAGREVIVLEARDEPGGCASTVDAIGARVNICNCDHTMVLASGIVEELDLAPPAQPRPRRCGRRTRCAALAGRQPELSRYRTPVSGPYLTGAATFPGAGVWGASGRNAAAVILAARNGKR